MTIYYRLGEDFHAALLKDLQQAEHFIMMEYFIVEEGKMWNPIHAILREKATQGISVYLLYDDFGCMLTLPERYYERLCSEGIHCIPACKFKPILSHIHNNRDHRKITVIDGNIGYTGGINLADEYINAVVKHGHWKDTAVRTEGEAVRNLTALFLANWNMQSSEHLDCSAFLEAAVTSPAELGVVIPFGDAPRPICIIIRKERKKMNRIALMILRNLWKAPAAYGRLCYYAGHANQYPEEEKYDHIQYIMQRAVASGNIDLQVYGAENIPKESGFMLYANHQGLFDIVAIVATCDIPIATVLKKELYDLPFLHQIALCTNSFAMDRENTRQSITIIQSVIKEVEKGRNYLIFPEGTRSRQGNQLLEFHSGSFRCADKTHCPIIPIALYDSYKVLDQRGCKQVAVQIHYLKPICYEEYQGMNTHEIARLVRKRIEKTLASIC